MTGEASDDGPREAVAAPSPPPPVIPAKAGIHGGKGRVFGRIPSTDGFPRPHGNRNRDTNMDSRFRGNDEGRAPTAPGGPSARGGYAKGFVTRSFAEPAPSPSFPRSGRGQAPRKRESMAGKDGSLSVSPRPTASLVPTETGIGIRIWIPAFAGMTKGGRDDGPGKAVGSRRIRQGFRHTLFHGDDGSIPRRLSGGGACRLRPAYDNGMNAVMVAQIIRSARDRLAVGPRAQGGGGKSASLRREPAVTAGFGVDRRG